MKTLLYLMLPAWLSLPAFSQQDENMLTIGVLTPETHKTLNAAQLELLHMQVQLLSSMNGISGDGSVESFVLYPTFNMPGGVRKSQGGMKAIYVADGYFSLFVKERHSGKVLASFNRAVKGSGLSEELALNNALTLVKPEDDDVKKFFADARNAVVNYYAKNCTNLIAKAEQQLKARDFTGAINLLYGIPPEAGDCFQKSQSTLQRAFNDYQTQQCGSNLQQAQAAAAAYDFKKAMEYLGLVDPTGPCGAEAKKFLKTVEPKIDKQVDRTWQLYNKIVEGQVQANAARYEVMREMMHIWGRNQGTTVSYHEISGGK